MTLSSCLTDYIPDTTNGTGISAYIDPFSTTANVCISMPYMECLGNMFTSSLSPFVATLLPSITRWYTRLYTQWRPHHRAATFNARIMRCRRWHQVYTPLLLSNPPHVA